MKHGKITYHGYKFWSESEYRKYLGLMQLQKSGRIRDIEVHPEYPLIVNDVQVTEYIPSFKFFDPEKNHERIIHVMNSAHNPALELKIKLFEALTNFHVERWG